MVEPVSIKALRPATISIISNLLNPPKVIPTDNGLLRNWTGLAQLLGVDGPLMPHLLQESDKTAQILKLWLSKDKENATIPYFLQCMEKLDRFDIIDDTAELIEADINFYKNQPKAELKPIELQNDKLILTVDDVTNIEKGLPLQNYDAFVLFDDDDIIIATELIEKLEKDYKLKLCVTERDLVGGTFEFDAATRLITERCNRMIVIISPAFLESQANTFFVKFAQAIGIEQRRRKVIPCVFKPTCIPVDLMCYHILDYQKRSMFFDFWQKLRDSIVSVPIESNNLRTNGVVVEYRGNTESKRTNNTLQPHKDSVKFKSDLDLYTQTKDEIITQTPIIASTSSDSLTTAKQESKPKHKSWKKLLLPNLNIKSDKESSGTNNSHSTKSKYKKFFSRYSKKAVES